MRIHTRNLLAVALGAGFAFAGSSASAVTIYQDDFSGDGLSSLNGLAPDVAPGAETWAAGANILNNGMQSGAGRFTALLPFSPVQGAGVYTLSASFDMATADNWMALGFAQDLAPAGGGLNDRWLDGSNNSRPSAWALVRHPTAANPDNSFLGYAGGNHTFGGVAGPVTTSNSLTITIDTTAADWEITWDFNSDGVDRTETVLAADVPNINYVGFSSTDSTGTGGLTSFLLDGPAPPPAWAIDGGGSFNTASNWWSNTVPTDIAVLGGAITAPVTVTLNAGVSLDKVSFNNVNSYTLAGPGTLTLTGDAEIESANGNHFVAARISGSSGLTKTGAGTVTLTNGSNNYTGGTSVAEGILDVRALGAVQGSGAIDVAGMLLFNGDGAGGGAAGTLSEQITGAGSVRLEGVDENNPGDGLTTETITVSANNAGFTGDFQVAGGNLRVTNVDALGDTTGVTGVSGGFSNGTVVLGNTSVAGETLEIFGRQPGVTDAHLSSIGNNSWGGAIAGGVGGNQYNIESQSGTLTITGDITMPDTALGDTAFPNISNSARHLNLTGAGNGRIEGAIIDRTATVADGAETANISLVKSGSGTWTIASAGDQDTHHQGRTRVLAGTLAVESPDGTSGELFSRTVEVAGGATLNLSTFTQYNAQILEDPDLTPSTGDEIGQVFSGGGQINVGGTLGMFDDSSISPGDAQDTDDVIVGRTRKGTLNINGNLSYSTFTATPAGSLEFDLGNTTSASDSDRVVVSGTTTIAANAGSDRINVNLHAVEGALAGGTYTLVQSGSLATSGSASSATYNAAIVDPDGNDITADAFQTVTVLNSGNNIVASVSAARNLNWQGGVSDAWDVKTTSNWTGSGTQFGQLDRVVFGNVANKNVEINADVLPGSTTFNPGANNTYNVTGTGGIRGGGAVNINSGTVKLMNTGNDYSGTTTVASSARLEIASGTTGNMNVSGTLSIGGDAVISGGATTFYTDNFSGPAATPLNGTTPGTSFDGSSWVAAPNFEADGNSVTIVDDLGGSATLGFVPVNGATYVLEGSIDGVTGDSDWFGLGFVNGQSTNQSTNNRFITNNTEGIAWTFYRGDASGNANQAWLGNPGVEPNSGIVDSTPWAVDANTGGGDVSIRISLDTTGGDGNWTATWEADTGSGYNVVRAETGLLSQAITAVGFANSNANDMTGTLSGFSLTGVEPANSRLLNAAALNVDGDLNLGSASRLEMDIASDTTHDSVAVSGTASLDGVLELNAINESFLSVGDLISLVTADSVSGTFDSINGVSVSAGKALAVIYEADAVNAVVARPGDTDLDGDVDDADLGNAFSNYTGPIADAAVPEPASLALLGLAVPLGMLRRRR